jgi:hypothetical protein
VDESGSFPFNQCLSAEEQAHDANAIAELVERMLAMPDQDPPGAWEEAMRDLLLGSARVGGAASTARKLGVYRCSTFAESRKIQGLNRSRVKGPAVILSNSPRMRSSRECIGGSWAWLCISATSSRMSNNSSCAFPSPRM